MRKRSAYEDIISQKLSQLSVPDIEQAWLDMKKLLEKKKKDKPVPFLLLKGCAAWLLILLVLSIGSIVLIEKKHTRNTPVINKIITSPTSNERSGPKMNSREQRNRIVHLTKAKKIAPSLNHFLRPVSDSQEVNPAGPHGHRENILSFATRSTTLKINHNEPVLKGLQAGPIEKPKQQTTNYLVAGIGLRQIIPVDGQAAVPYNLYGRKGSLADYIPSPFIAFHHGRKWFIQLSARYGAPQLVKQFVYSNNRVDSFGSTVIKKSLTVKKTFYHEIPLTFHYRISKGLSVSAGLEFNKFYSAISDQELRSRNLLTQSDSLISSKLVTTPLSSDSLFSKTFFRGSIGLHYQFRKFSIHLEYIEGLQPFIRYSLDNHELEKKNRGVQLSVNYDIWRSLKKR